MAFLRPRGLAILLALLGLLGVAGAGAATFAWFYLLHDLPDLKTIQDYHPLLASRVLDRQGREIGEFYSERRRLVALESVPRHVIDAFVAGEDSTFYEHAGIDFPSILRAAWVNLRAGGEIRQGASTITQQVVKGLLLTPERHFRRKIREMILARQIEQRFGKEEILYLYLNQIYFGHGAWGLGEAARTYFGKDVSALTLSEGALLAGLPKAPSRFSPFANPEEAEKRRRYVLSRMLEDGRIDEAAYEAAREERPALAEQRPDAAIAAASFTEEVRRHLFEALGADLVLRGGLLIETTLDLDLQRSALRALRQGLIDLEARHGYRGHVRRVAAEELASELERLAAENGLEGAGASPRAIRPGVPYLGLVTGVDGGSQTARVGLAPGLEARVRLEDAAWASPASPESVPRPVTSIERVFRTGDVAYFERLEAPGAEAGAGAHPAPLALRLHQEPVVQGALLSLDLARGEVLALVGGTDFEKSQFNRVTQARRQPGSAFKPFIYGAALTRGWTAASIIHDRPVVYLDESSGMSWRPRNFERKFYGPMTLREALSRSVNNASVHLFRDVGVDYVIDFARRLGIESPLHPDLSLALGSNEVTLLELTRAYAVFAAGGRRVVPTFIRRVTDPSGRVLLENQPLGPGAELAGPAPEEGTPPEPEPLLAQEETLPLEPENGHGSAPAQAPLPEGYVLAPETAYLVTDLLRAVVQDPHGTGWRLRALQRPLAGKTGTTNDQADAWFLGFSPEIATGVWVGYDESRFLGKGETGGRAAAPIWVDFMRDALAEVPVRDFALPEPIVFARIDRKTGLLADASSQDTVFQSFLAGTEPTRTAHSDREEERARETLLRDF
jgi:penicillin-binding protein 1A